MKHTIKSLTVAITLAAILTLTGCPGPVNTIDPVVVPEYKITVNVTHGTAEYPTTAKAGDPVTITATAEEGYTIYGVASAFTISDYSVTNNGTVINLNFSMVTEDVVINMAFRDVSEETPYMLTYIAGGCDDPNCPNELRYQYNGEDDYKTSLSIYSSEEDTEPIQTLYFSFEKDSLSKYSEIEIDDEGVWIKLSSLLQMKPNYDNCEVESLYTPNNGWVNYEDNGNITDSCWKGLTNSKINSKIIITNQ